MIFTTDQALFRRSKIMLDQATLAMAIFDNSAESKRELDFEKGDVLQVLDQHPSGLQGWWMCRLEGRDGLAAANRLRLLKTNARSADYDIPKPLLSEKTRHSNGATSPSTYDNPRQLRLPDSPPSVRSHRSSFAGSSSILFRSPPSTSGSSHSGSSRFSMATSDLGPSERNSSEPCGDLYDVIPGPARKIGNPSPVGQSNSRSKDGDYDYIDADITSPSESHYDCLPKRTALPRKTLSKDAKKRESFLRCARLYDVLPKQSAVRMVPITGGGTVETVGNAETTTSSEQLTEDPRSLPIYEPLNITKQTALNRISFMQSQVQTELSRLFSFVSYAKWREPAHLATCLNQVKLCCQYLVNHLKGLIRFLLQAALASASNASDASLELKLRSLIDAVYISCKGIREELAVLDEQAWAANLVTIRGIEGIVATGQVLTEDVRKMTAFVLGNAQLIFSKVEEVRVQLRPLPVRPELGQPATTPADDEDHEYEDVDYGLVSAPLQPRSPNMQKKILNSYIQEVDEEVAVIGPLVEGFATRMFAEKTVTSVGAIERGEAIGARTSKLVRLTESLSRNLTTHETLELREKVKKIGSYIATACKRFNSALRAATKTPDDEHFRSVKASLDYLNELCQFLKNSTETEV